MRLSGRAFPLELNISSVEAVSGVNVSGLTVRYGDITAVDNVSFSAPQGSVTVILGPNGAGKTSTIEVCEGFRQATAGTVSVLGLNPDTQHAELTSRMGVMLQGGGVYPSARVRDVIAHFCALYNKGVNAPELVERVGLSHRATGTWRRLSGGEQQRLSLALALAAQPEVAFLDEPTSGVDIDGRDTIRGIITDLASNGTTVVLASHEMAEAERVAQHAVLFKQGRVVAAGAVSELLQQRDTVRFGSSASVDITALSSALGVSVLKTGDASYEVASSSSPQLVATLSQWLADNNLPLNDLRVGSESLEDAYRRLTGGQA